MLSPTCRAVARGAAISLAALGRSRLDRASGIRRSPRSRQSARIPRQPSARSARRDRRSSGRFQQLSQSGYPHVRQSGRAGPATKAMQRIPARAAACIPATPVLDHRAPEELHCQAPGRQEEHVRSRLAARHLIRAGADAEAAGDLERVQHMIDEAERQAGGHRQRSPRPARS